MSLENKNSLVIAFFLFLVIFNISHLACEENTEENNKNQKGSGLILLPVVFYTPETKFAAGVVGFVGLGDVVHKINNFAFKNIKWALGAGIRYILSRGEKINFRFDVGFTKESVGVYFMVSEAF